MGARKMMDIAVTGHRELKIVNGDFVIVESTAEHQAQLILNGPGDYKTNPTVGVGALDYANDEDKNALPAAIATAFAQDGMDVVSVALSPNGIINSDAYYPG